MFRNAWNLGKISGIDIRIHWSFLLLPLWVYYSTISQGGGSAAAILSVVFILAVFGCVLLHELGHALAARQFGIGTRDIILLPIGGVASLERMPRKPLQELWIAVAGPLVNVVIAAVIILTLPVVALTPGSLAAEFFANLAWVNMALVAFNMIPAFPMDGGRVLRSVIAMFKPYARATIIAATVGKYCAIGLAIYGLLSGNFMLILLAGFVYLVGQAEKMQVLMREGQSTFTHQNAGAHFGATSFQQQAAHEQYGQREISVPSTLTGDAVVAWLSHMHAEYCSVVESGRVIGRLTKAQLLSALSRGFGPMPIGQILAHAQG